MSTIEVRVQLPATLEEIYGWHARPGAFERLNPPWDPATVVARSGEGLQVGVELELRLPTVGWTMRTRHVAHVPPEEVRNGTAAWAGFVDEQQQGPFAAWRHEHRFTDGSLVDHITFEMPLGVGGGLLVPRIRRAFAFRHDRTRLDLERHRPWRDQPRKRVVIAGGTGLVGRELAAFLSTGGHEVRVLSRSGPIRWDPQRGILDPAVLDGVDVVVNLAGEPISGRWTATRREEMARSRLAATELLVNTIGACRTPPALFLSGSAVGWYGDRADRELTEEASPGEGFLADLARRWEEIAGTARSRTRVILLRTGLVLSARGGLLGTLLPLARVGALGPIRGGRNYMPWIAVDDWVGAVHFLMWTDGLEGPMNLTAPDPIPQRVLARTLGAVLGRPAILPTPAAAVTALYGQEAAQDLVFTSQRVVPARLAAAGFRFAHADLESALRFELGG